MEVNTGIPGNPSSLFRSIGKTRWQLFTVKFSSGYRALHDNVWHAVSGSSTLNGYSQVLRYAHRSFSEKFEELLKLGSAPGLSTGLANLLYSFDSVD